MNLLEKYRPKTLKEYGNNQATMVSKNYVEGIIRGIPLSKAILLHGEPGNGKTTLVRCIANDYNLILQETNASQESGKELFRHVRNSVLNGSVNGERKAYFFDEVDGLDKNDQKRLVKILEGCKDPVFLACNFISKIGPELKSKCLEVRVDKPREDQLKNLRDRLVDGEGFDVVPIHQSMSFRDLISGYQGGERLEGIDDGMERLKMMLTGKGGYLKPSEFWMAEAWLTDNTKGREPLNFSLWQSRYKQIGKPAEKYVNLALQQKVGSVDFPWSLRVRGQAKKAAAKPAPKKPVKKAAEVLKTPVAAPPPPKTANISDFF